MKAFSCNTFLSTRYICGICGKAQIQNGKVHGPDYSVVVEQNRLLPCGRLIVRSPAISDKRCENSAALLSVQHIKLETDWVARSRDN